MSRISNRRRPLARTMTWLPLAAASLMASVALPLQAQQLIAPDASIAGFSQGQLAAQFAQWSGAYPIGVNPTRDDTGAFSAAGNQGSYFFLGASGTEDPIVRSVTVRPNQTLFVSLLAYIDYVGGAVVTEADLREEIGYALGNVSNLSVTVDGAPALMPAGFTSLQQFRQSSPLFDMNFIANNIFGVPESVLPAVSEGYLVALQALPAGNHSLHFTALSEATGPFAGFTFSQDITYKISSVPEPASWAILTLGLLALGATGLRRRRPSPC